MTLKDIFLRKIDSILNPTLENRIISTLLILGVSLVGIPSVIALKAKFSIETGGTSFTAEITNGPDLIFFTIGVVCIAVAVFLFLNKQKREDLIKTENSKENLHCQYFVCRNFEILKEISELKLNRFPVKDPLLIKNHVFSSLIDIVSKHPESNRHATIYGNSFSTEKEYLEQYSHPKEIEKSEQRYPYYKNIRLPSPEEIQELSRKDGVVNAMLHSGFEKDILVVGCYEDGCAGIEWQEEYLMRELWGIFLAIENISDKPITLNSIEGEISEINGFNNFNIPLSSGRIKLPQTPIKPGTTVLIPVAMALPPTYPINIETLSTKNETSFSERYQVTSHCSIKTPELQEIIVYGGLIRPDSVLYTKQGQNLNHSIHKLDLSNFYEIDLHWGCGSCPHLFFVDTETSYERELIASCQNQTGKDSFTIPNGIKKIIIAEIEDEVTVIESILIDGKTYKEDIELKKGDTIEITVSPGQTIEITGQYIPLTTINSKVPAGRIRNRLIHEFLS